MKATEYETITKTNMLHNNICEREISFDDETNSVQKMKRHKNTIEPKNRGARCNDDDGVHDMPKKRPN